MSVTPELVITVIGGAAAVVFTVLLFLLPGRFREERQELLDSIDYID